MDMATALHLSLVGTLALVAGIAVFEAFVRRPKLALVCILAAYLATTATDSRLPLTVGAINVNAEDIVFSATATAAVARLLRRRILGDLHLLMIMLGIVALISLLIGIMSFGIEDATSSFRKTFYFLSGALYFSTFPLDRRTFGRWQRLWVVFGLAMLALALVRWMALAGGFTGPLLGTAKSLRTLGAAPALLIAQAFLFIVPTWRTPRAEFHRYIAPALLVGVILLTHRTVWIVLIICGLVLLRGVYGMGERLRPVLAASLILGLIVSLLLSSAMALDLGETFSDRASNASTLEWRYEGWRALLLEDRPQGLREFLLGSPFGTGFERELERGEVSVSPHNYYVETYLRMGLLGTVMLIVLYASVARRLSVAAKRRGDVDVVVLYALVLSQIVFFLTYSPSPPQGVLLGMAVSALSGFAASDSPRSSPVGESLTGAAAQARYAGASRHG